MRRWLSSRGSVQSAEVDEIAREVHLRLLNYGDDVLAENPQEHLFRVATGVINEWHEPASGDVFSGDVSDDEALPANNIESRRVEQLLVNHHVSVAVSHLPSQQREALLLHVEAELTYRQVAARMKLTPSAARRDIVRGYVSLQQQLARSAPVKISNDRHA